MTDGGLPALPTPSAPALPEPGGFDPGPLPDGDDGGFGWDDEPDGDAGWDGWGGDGGGGDDPPCGCPHQPGCPLAPRPSLWSRLRGR